MLDKVGLLVSEVLSIPEAKISDELAMTDIESWDSLKHMELIVSLEESLGLQFTFDEIVAMQSVGKIKQVLRERGVERR